MSADFEITLKNDDGEDVTLPLAANPRFIRAYEKTGRKVQHIVMECVRDGLSFSDAEAVIYHAWKAARPKDTRFSQEDIGDMLWNAGGHAQCAALLVDFGTYVCTGGQPLEKAEPTEEEKKS